MNEVKRCRAKGGPANCKDPNCPEKKALADFAVPSFFTASKLTREPAQPVGVWTEKDTVLYKTIHGSRLYGLSNANSDEDYYIVTPTVNTKRLINAKQKIIGNLDTVAVDFSSFVALAHRGNPQALETMFSQKSKSDFFEDYRAGFFTSEAGVIETYLKTIKSFSLVDDDDAKAYKYRRHAMRLSTNLEELMYTGRFNPTLSPAVVRNISKLAETPGKKYFAELNKLQPVELNWEQWLVDREEKRRLKAEVQNSES